MALAVLLVGGVSVPGWGDAYSADDSYLSISLPFSISMYNYSTSNPALQSNGASILLIDFLEGINRYFHHKNQSILLFRNHVRF